MVAVLSALTVPSASTVTSTVPVVAAPARAAGPARGLTAGLHSPGDHGRQHRRGHGREDEAPAARLARLPWGGDVMRDRIGGHRRLSSDCPHDGATAPSAASAAREAKIAAARRSTAPPPRRTTRWHRCWLGGVSNQ